MIACVIKRILIKNYIYQKIVLTILMAGAIFTSCSNEINDQGKTDDNDGPVGISPLY